MLGWCCHCQDSSSPSEESSSEVSVSEYSRSTIDILCGNCPDPLPVWWDVTIPDVVTGTSLRDYDNRDWVRNRTHKLRLANLNNPFIGLYGCQWELWPHDDWDIWPFNLLADWTTEIVYPDGTTLIRSAANRWRGYGSNIDSVPGNDTDSIPIPYVKNNDNPPPNQILVQEESWGNSGSYRDNPHPFANDFPNLAGHKIGQPEIRNWLQLGDFNATRPAVVLSLTGGGTPSNPTTRTWSVHINVTTARSTHRGVDYSFNNITTWELSETAVNTCLDTKVLSLANSAAPNTRNGLWSGPIVGGAGEYPPDSTVTITPA